MTIFSVQAYLFFTKCQKVFIVAQRTVPYLTWLTRKHSPLSALSSKLLRVWKRFSVANYDHDRTISWDSLIICFSVWYSETFCLDLFVLIGTAERHIIIWERFKIVTFASYLRQIPPFSLLLGRFREDFIPISFPEPLSTALAYSHRGQLGSLVLMTGFKNRKKIYLQTVDHLQLGP